MTVHLACPSRGETYVKPVTGSSQRNSHPRFYSGMVLYYAPVPRAANFRCRRTQLWTTVNQAGRCRYAEGSQLMPQDCRAAIAWRRISWQLTVRDADPTNICPFTTWYYTRYWVWNFEKVFKHSTHRAHKLDSAITLGYVNCFGCECTILLCTRPLMHTIKMLLH